MNKPVLNYVKKLAVIFTVILAGFASLGSLQAQTVIASVSISAQNGSLTYGTGGSVTFQISFTSTGSGAGSSDLSINWIAPTGATTSLPSHINFTGTPSAIPVTITTTSATPAGTTSFTITSTSGPFTSASQNFVVGGKPLTITGITGHNREYDASLVATVDGIPGLSGVVAGDELNVAVGGSPVFAFTTASVGTGKPILTTTGYTLSGSASGNYILIQPAALTANITAKALTITGLTVVNKPYDGFTTATITGTAALAGIIVPDVVTLGGTPVLNFADALVGNAKPITVSGYTISGAASGNYTVTQPVGLTANITAKALTITGLSGVNRVYNGFTTATTTGTAALSGIVGSDAVTLGGTPVLNFADALVGNAKPITVTGYTISGAASGNYTITQPAGLTANITPLALTISGLTGNPKPYDRTTGATTLGTAAINGVLAGDAGNVVLDASAAEYTFATATVGTNKPITATGYLLTGTAAGNYSVGPLTGVTANITAISLTITGAVASPKPYDGTNAAVITGTLNGILDPDVVTLTGTGTFASVNVGAGIAVTSACTLGGADGGNYLIAAQPSGLTANITPRPLTITATGPVKFYGTPLTAGVSTTNFTATGLVAGESVTSITLRPNAAGLVATTAAGYAYTVTPEPPITVAGGFLVSNYTIAYNGYAGTVSPRSITVTPDAGQRKVLGAADPILTYTFTPALIGSDIFTGALSRSAGETVGGSPYAITIGTLTAGPNYALTLAPATFAITSASLAAITAFNFTLLPNYAETINQPAGTIAVPVANSANVATLVARYTVSAGAVVRVGGVVQTNGVTTNNFTGAVNYVVTSADGTATQAYNVTVTKNAVVIAKQLVTLFFAAIPGSDGVFLDPGNDPYTITAHIPATYPVTSLVATFTLSPLAKAYVGGVLQTSGVTVNNFTAALTNPGFSYTIQAENGSDRVFYVKLVRDAARTEKQLLSFSLPGIEGAIDEMDHSVRLAVPFSYVLTGKIAAFTSSFLSTVWIGAAQQTSGVTINDFTPAPGSMTYTVKSENPALTQDYTLYITRIAVSTASDMLTFQFNGLAAPAVGNIVGTSITVTVPHSANMVGLVATFTNSPLSAVTISGITQVSGTTPNIFTSPLVYTVTAEDGTTIKTYTVTVTQTPASSLNALLTFSVGALGGSVSGAIDQIAKTVLVEVPYGTNIADLVATFTVSDFATVKIASVPQVSGVTRNNFSGVKPYTIIAEDGVNTEIYYVTVRVFPAMVTFGFNDLATQPAGVINHTLHTITVHVPFTVVKTALKAYFTVSGGATASILTVAQTSGVTVNDFTNPLTYTLQVPGGSVSTYAVTVISDPVRTGKQILTYAFNGLTPACTGVVDEALKTVAVTVPFGTNVTALVSTFTLSDMASAKVGTLTQVNGTTPNNFTTPVVYTVTAENGLTQTYTVTVTVTPGSSAKDITYFAFEDLNPDVVCVINQTTLTITATVLNGTDRSILRAFFTASPLSSVRVLGTLGGIQQSGLTYNDFRTPVQYQVTAQDGSTKVYTVSISEGPDITAPVVSNASVTVSNLPGQYVMVRSNESTGKLYIINSTVVQVTIANLDAAVTAGFGRSVYISVANTDYPISTANLPEGFYYAYAIDATGNMSAKGTNRITVLDRIPPIVTVAAQTKSNSLTNVVNVKSSDANSLVYIILEGEPQTGQIDLNNAVAAHKGSRGIVSAANVDVPLSVYQLVPGNYHAYAVDLSGNLSTRSTNVVVITEASRLKSILAFSFNGLTPPAIGQIIGTDISVKVRVGTPVTALVATFLISDLSKAYVGSTLQTSNSTANDFTNPVTYRVVAEDGSFADYIVTVSFNTGIDVNEWFTSIKSYPNPVSDRLTIEMTRPADRIQIINALGQTIEDVRNPGQTIVEIQTSSWMKGIYFVRYYLDQKYIGVQKLMKE